MLPGPNVNDVLSGAGLRRDAAGPRSRRRGANRVTRRHDVDVPPSDWPPLRASRCERCRDHLRERVSSEPCRAWQRRPGSPGKRSPEGVHFAASIARVHRRTRRVRPIPSRGSPRPTITPLLIREVSTGTPRAGGRPRDAVPARRRSSVSGVTVRPLGGRPGTRVRATTARDVPRGRDRTGSTSWVGRARDLGARRPTGGCRGQRVELWRPANPVRSRLFANPSWDPATDPNMPVLPARCIRGVRHARRRPLSGDGIGGDRHRHR